MIFGYLRHIDEELYNTIPNELNDIIFTFYALEISLNQKAIKICYDEELENAMKFLAFQYNINNDPEDINSNQCHENGIDLMADFLHLDHPYIDPDDVGEFITTLESIALTENQHKKLLYSFLRYVPYGDLNFIEAFRKLLIDSGLKLPKYPQKIDRLMDAFSNIYAETNQLYNIGDSDVFLVLSWATLMLDNDLRNPIRNLRNNQSPINIEQFYQLVQSDDNPIPKELCDEIYTEILENPLKGYSV